jgi:hypothetical protein
MFETKLGLLLSTVLPILATQVQSALFWVIVRTQK